MPCTLRYNCGDMPPHDHSEDRAEEFVRSLDTLFAQAIRSAFDEKQMLQDTLDAGLRAVRGARGFLALVNHETGELRVRCVAGKGWDNEYKQMRLHLGDEAPRGITGHVAPTGRPCCTPQVV